MLCMVSDLSLNRSQKMLTSRQTRSCTHSHCHSLADLCMQVRSESDNVFRVYGSKEFKTKWNSYRACMRRDGVWGSMDLNAKLTDDVFGGVMTRYEIVWVVINGTHQRKRWNKTVNITVPTRISQLVKVAFPFGQC
jgi:hypothetical protein